MLDDLRSSATYQDDDEDEVLEQKPEAPRKRPRPARSSSSRGGRILGMTAQQRFIVVALLFILVCIGGVVALLATGAVNLPIY